MSQENIEIVRRLLDPYAIGSLPRTSEFEGLLDPAVRLDLSARVFNPAVYVGYGGIARWRAEVDEDWESYGGEPERFVDGDQVVVVFMRERGRGKRSRVEIGWSIALLCRLSAGRVSEIRLYHDREQALRDAGLEE